MNESIPGIESSKMTEENPDMMSSKHISVNLWITGSRKRSENNLLTKH